jgi:hypothetical protein
MNVLTQQVSFLFLIVIGLIKKEFFTSPAFLGQRSEKNSMNSRQTIPGGDHAIIKFSKYQVRHSSPLSSRVDYRRFSFRL